VAMHQCSARLSWTPRETVRVAAKLTPHTWVGLQLLCMLEPNHTTLASSPCATHLPPVTLVRGSWWKLAVRVPPMNGCQHVQARLTSTSPAYNHPTAQDGNQHSGVLSAHPHTRGRMSTRVMIPPHLHSPRCRAYHLVQREGNQRAIFTPRSRGGTKCRVIRSRVPPYQTPRITHVRW
jgi:hypothetical protein